MGPIQGRGVLALCKLNLKDDVTVASKGRFTDHQVEAPHPIESLVANPSRPLQMGLEADALEIASTLLPPPKERFFAMSVSSNKSGKRYIVLKIST